jgi:hypothetical protein
MTVSMDGALQVGFWHFCDFARHSSMVGTQVNCGSRLAYEYTR